MSHESDIIIQIPTLMIFC